MLILFVTSTHSADSSRKELSTESTLAVACCHFAENGVPIYPPFEDAREAADLSVLDIRWR